jgi:hypothetical protein
MFLDILLPAMLSDVKYFAASVAIAVHYVVLKLFG